MNSKLQNLWENVRSSLWFLPSILVAGMLIASSILIEVDVFLSRQQSEVIPWLFSGTADAAYSLLSTIAGSVISVISIAFSLTIIALQQAATQYTPRVLRTFTSSRGNQIVLGAYTATFVYALLVLRTVRSANEGAPFVPALSVTVAVGLALLCLGLLIYFIHHTSQTLQVSVIIDQIRTDLVGQLKHMYPSQTGEPAPDELPTDEIERRFKQQPSCHVLSRSTGFVRTVDENALLNVPLDDVEWLCVRPQAGQFVPEGGVLAEFIGDENSMEQAAEAIRNAVVLDQERSLRQDPLFGIRQLVDIGLKALSPGINDPTTAEYVLRHLGMALSVLASREFPSSVRSAEQGKLKLLLNRPTWDDYMTAAFSQIRREASQDVHVTNTLLQVLAALAERIPNYERAQAIRRQVLEIRQSIEQQKCGPTDQQQLEEMADLVEARLHEAIARNANVVDAD